jgi:gas vesicle protein
MGVIRSSVLLLAGAAAGGALLIAHRVSQETGKGLTESFADVPGEAQRLFADIRGRLDEAVARGREAYHEKQSAMEEHLGDAPRS